GGDTETSDTEETDGITDPDTQWAGQWSYVEMETPTTADLAAVWGTWFGNVWAVGEDGVILHFDGTGWTEVEYEADAHHNLHAISGASADLIWAAGASNFMLEYDGASWQQQNMPFQTADISWRGLCVRTPEELEAYVVGEHGKIVPHVDGGWIGIKTCYAGVPDFHAAWCADETDIFIAGHDHTAFKSSVLHREPPASSSEISESVNHEPIDNMYGIAGDDDGNVWAVGFDDGVGSKLYRNDGDEFDVQTTSDDELLGLWAHSTLGVWAVGNTADDDAVGVIQAWTNTGDPEYHVEFDGTSRFRGIWGVDNISDKHLIAVGKNGTILHIFWDPF
ncbi:MAG: hypothetical protein JRF63_01965, partial [Deltaproteobacteria bacterium]|nr:hypothetical protein [Deltaproteobacteria bacterium]